LPKLTSCTVDAEEARNRALEVVRLDALVVLLPEREQLAPHVCELDGAWLEKIGLVEGGANSGRLVRRGGARQL
jgi:hypothetical protein